MNSIELKNKIINRVRQVDDEEILKEIYKLLDDSLEDPDIMMLSENHKNAIEIAKVQMEKGEYLNNEQANKEIGKWLNK